MFSMPSLYWNCIKRSHQDHPPQLTQVHQTTMQRLLERVRNILYRYLIWISNKLAGETEIPQDRCDPKALFERMMLEGHMRWGHYVCFMEWLDYWFPLNGPDIVRYLKKQYPSYHYSVMYLTREWVLYHAFNTIIKIHRPFGTWFVGWCASVCPSDETE